MGLNPAWCTGAVFGDLVAQSYSVNSEIVGLLLGRSPVEALIQDDDVAFELLGVGLGWHDR